MGKRRIFTKEFKEEAVEPVRTGVFKYIEIYYNRRRRHSVLGYTTPLALTFWDKYFFY